jgi:hypothetical protein
VCGVSSHVFLTPSLSSQRSTLRSCFDSPERFSHVTVLSQTREYDGLMPSAPTNWVTVRCFIRPGEKRLRKATGGGPADPTSSNPPCGGVL